MKELLPYIPFFAVIFGPVLLILFCGACELIIDKIYGKQEGQEFDPPEGL